MNLLITLGLVIFIVLGLTASCAIAISIAEHYCDN